VRNDSDGETPRRDLSHRLMNNQEVISVVRRRKDVGGLERGG
jgi:hypothetical protein